MKKLFVFALVLLLTTAAQAATVQRQVDVSPGERLSVVLQSGGSIEVRGWDRNSVELTATVGRNEPGVGFEKRGDVVSVTWSGPARNASFRLQVPRRFDLTLDTNGGEIAVDNIGGAVKAATRGGDLRVARVEGKVTMSTHGGTINVRDSNLAGSISTMGGEILFENVVGTVKASTMGGNVTSRHGGAATNVENAVELSTMGGNILVDSAPGGANLSTMGGNVTVKSAARRVRARTMGGNIELDSVAGSVDASTMGGNVSAHLLGGAGSRDVTIESKGGDIELVVPDGFGMTVDAEIVVTKSSTRRYTVQSDFPLEISSTPRSSGSDARTIVRGRGQVGAGTHKVRIRTMDGDVKIRRDGR